jgi:hypothetical protein
LDDLTRIDFGGGSSGDHANGGEEHEECVHLGVGVDGFLIIESVQGRMKADDGCEEVRASTALYLWSALTS